MKYKNIIIIAITALLVAFLATPYIAYMNGYYVMQAPDIPNGVIYNPTYYRDFDRRFIKFYWFAVLRIGKKLSIRKDPAYICK